MTQKEKAEKHEIEIKAKLYDLQKQIATKSAFLEYYYKILPKCNSQKDAFDIVNLLHNLVFKEEKYSSYTSFRIIKNRDIKK